MALEIVETASLAFERYPSIEYIRNLLHEVDLASGLLSLGIAGRSGNCLLPLVDWQRYLRPSSSAAHTPHL
jgi:hypothetical protein